jgi:hypothetical protein
MNQLTARVRYQFESYIEWSLARVVCVALLVYTSPLRSAEITVAEVVMDDRQYSIDMRAEANVDITTLLTVLRDYDLYTTLSPSIIESRLVSEEDDALRLMLVMRPCIFGFCRNLIKVTDITWLNEKSVRYRGVPGAGHFEMSVETITVSGNPDQPSAAIFLYRAELVPAFFIPPVIGNWLISRQIQKELLSTLERIEVEFGESR